MRGVRMMRRQGWQDDDTHVAMRNQDITKEPAVQYYTIESNDFMSSRSSGQSKSSTRSHGCHSTVNFHVCRTFRSIRDLKHYRIVFKEVGTPVDDLTGLKSVFKALRDACRGKSFQCGCIAIYSFACRSAVAFPSRLRTSGCQRGEHSNGWEYWQIDWSRILQDN